MQGENEAKINQSLSRTHQILQPLRLRFLSFSLSHCKWPFQVITDCFLFHFYSPSPARALSIYVNLHVCRLLGSGFCCDTFCDLVILSSLLFTSSGYICDLFQILYMRLWRRKIDK
jgi:hypothetical protein